jgi:ubiquinone/menaquinone biosynthesis C-methylase UbiE
MAAVASGSLNNMFWNQTIINKNQAPREEWLEKTLKEIPAGSRILDAGAGERQYKRFCSHLKYVSQDFAQYDGKGDSVGMQTGAWNNDGLDIVSDITNIPEPDASFDAIMCIEVLEHVPDPARVFLEFARLLKKGGTLIITSPFNSLTHFAPYHFSTGFSRYFYETHLKQNNFSVSEITPNGNYFSYLEQEIDRLPHTAKLYARPLTYGDRILRKLCLRMLSTLDASDHGSSELLCFGYHVVAKKK